MNKSKSLKELKRCSRILTIDLSSTMVCKRFLCEGSEKLQNGHLYFLSKVIGSRGSATPKEHRAALYCREVLIKAGYSAEILQFKALTTFGWLYMVIYLIPLLSWALNMPFISLAGAIFFFLDLNTFPVLSRIFPKKQSRNVYAFKPDKSGQKIVLVAHIDSSKAGLNFSPSMVKGFRTSFLLMVASIISSPVLILASFLFGGFLRWIALIPCIYLLITSFMLLHREIWNKYTDGANDNASGVTTVLELAEKFASNTSKDLDLRILLTGSEESGTYGMIDFLEKYGEQHRDALFINLDNIGAGNLFYMSGEGMFPVYKASHELLDACETVSGYRPDLNVKQGVYSLLSTDAMPLLARKYKAISFLALDEQGMLPNWHWPTDIYENVSLKTIETAVEFLTELINELGRKKTYETRHLRNN